MTIAHRAARVFDGHDLREGIDVLTDGPTIVAVARRGDTPPDVEVLDHGRDSTLLPGLVDAHTHLVFSCIPDVPAGVPHDADGLDRLIRHNARRALAGGVTTVRDLGDSGYAVLAVRDETADDPSYPRILGAGPPLTTVGGHCAFLDGAAVTGSLGDAVAERLDRGVDVVKIMSSGGNVTANSTPPWLSQFVLAELREVVDAVHARGIPIAAHAHGSTAIRDAVAAGVDSIEHCTFMTADGTEAPDEVIAAIAESGVVASLTFSTAPGAATPPPALLARLPGIVDAIRRLCRSGATWVASSDAGIAPTKPHDVLSYGAAFAGWVGLDSIDSLRASTSRPAALLGLEGVVGIIAPGADADLLVVRGDPVAEPASLVDVLGVWRRGHRAAGPSKRPDPVRPPGI
ncbi:MAG: amidohydrolase family protein [Dermatophilaceae bacterium]